MQLYKVLFGLYNLIYYICTTKQRQRQSVISDKHRARCKYNNKILKKTKMVVKKTIKKLKLPRGKVLEIAEKLRISKRTVQRAMNLTNPTTGENADRCRVMARELGAVVVTEVNFIEA